MGGEAADSPVNPMADLLQMTQNRVDAALIDVLPGNLINEIVENKVREFIKGSFDAMIEKAILERFEKAMIAWARDADFTDRISHIGQQFIDNNLPKERIREATEKRVATLMGGKVDSMIEASVQKQFQDCLDKWMIENLTDVEFGAKYEEIVGDIAREYAKGMGQHLLSNVMRALQMIGSGAMLAANASVAVHEDLGECMQCHLIVKKGNECPMCKQHVW